MKKGTIIYLNGVSSAGKTTLARALQQKLPEPYYWLANDTFCDMSPARLWDADALETEFQALSLLNHTVKLFSDLGKNTIVDNVLLNTQRKGLLEECVDLLYGYPVLFVHVTCPVRELQRREKMRGDRSIGQAEGQLGILYPQTTYDITVDTFHDPIDVCADKVIALLDDPANHKAFHTLWSVR
jgi:chloramphenicol 3-O-phosphotransferase